MITVLSGFPDDVVAVRATGRVTRDDYAQVLVPAIERALSSHKKLSFYYELAPEMQGFDVGAMWEDARVGIAHLTRWERIAVVTDVEWLRAAVNLFRFLVPAAVRVFGTGEAAEAKAWISQPRAEHG